MTSTIILIIQIGATAGIMFGFLTGNLETIVANGFFLVNATIWAVRE